MPAVHLQQLESIPLAVVRRQALQSELSRVVPELCGVVWKAIGAQQAKAGRHVALYWDSTIRLEVGVEILGPFTEQDEVVHSATPSGQVATATNLGPYNTLGAAHNAIHQWCQANHRKPAGPSWEIYGHWLPEWNDDPSQIRTDIYYLLAS
jgi:effector-binding domain-containing protein